MTNSPIRTCLWMEKDGEAAATFYTRLQTHCFRGFGVIQGPRGELSDEQPFLAD